MKAKLYNQQWGQERLIGLPAPLKVDPKLNLFIIIFFLFINEIIIP